MASDIHRTLLLPVVLFLIHSALSQQTPVLDSAAVVFVTNPTIRQNECFKDVEFEVRGANFFSGMPIRLSSEIDSKNMTCHEESMYNVTEVKVSDNVAKYRITMPHHLPKFYFCLKNVDGDHQDLWYHQGPTVFFNAASYDVSQQSMSVKVTGLRVDSSAKTVEVGDNGVPSIFAGSSATLRLFGSGFNERMTLAFTTEKGDFGQICSVFPVKGSFSVSPDTLREKSSVSVPVVLPDLAADKLFYLCIRGSNDSAFYHQGSEPWVILETYNLPLPLWATIMIIGTCLCFSALFSGLNLGLMSLDMTELKILCNTGTPNERKFAKKIQPIRKHGNFLLCSILLGNVLVNSTFTILLDGLTSGLVAVMLSTIAIVLFGEITPQAICSRHGLAVGAKTIHITKVVMAITSPLAYPVSKILDCLLGEEIGNVYNRERLKELVKVTTGENDLDRDEVNIISGALELRKKTVAEAMTKIEDAFMLDYDAILDFETVSEIMKSGYSRVPVYEGDRKKIVTTLYIKDLAFVDPDDNTPLKTLCQFYQNPCNFVFEDVTLDIMFKEFKEGNKGHMAFVNRVNSEGDGDPFYETIGLITLEDVIEELIQAEIMDETDVFTDNRTKRRRTANRSKQDFTVFAERRGESNRVRISPQLTLATFQYLSTAVDLFKPNNISETILRRLLKQDIIYHIRRNKDWRNDDHAVIYQQGKAVDYFVLILEGRVEVIVGQEQLIFDSGPFTYFGTQALVQNVGTVEQTPSAMGSLQSLNMDTMLRYTFLPDYTVRACTDLLYMKVKRSLYLAAKKASLMEKSKKGTNTTGDFDEEVEKLLHSLGEEDSLGRSSPEPRPGPAQPLNTTHSEPLTTIYSPKLPGTNADPSNAASNFVNARELNGALKMHESSLEQDGNDEEVALLHKTS